MELTIIIPCYNEEAIISTTIPGILKFASSKDIKVIIVNDGSTDNTRDIIDNFSSPNLTILSHKLNRGYGAAIKSGILASKTKYSITIDADGQHELEDIILLYSIILSKDADMVVGSRIGQKSDSIYRGIGKSIIRSFARLLMKMPIEDLNSGMKIFNTEIAKRYLILLPNGMPFSDIIGLVFIFNRNLVLEHPIKINKRVGGTSTINTKTAFDTINAILNIVILFNPIKIFFPLTLFFLFLGIGWGLPFIILKKGVSVGASLLITLGFLTFLLGLLAEQLSRIRIENIQKNEK